MARMRTIKPEACTSESLAEVDRAVRWTFAALWTHCDDEGRVAWNPRLVKAAIYPLDDAVTLDVLRADIDELVRVGAVCKYTVDGREHLHVPSWSDHQHPNRRVDSKLPPCPKTDHSVPTHAHSSEDAVSPPVQSSAVVVVVGGDVDGKGEGAGRVSAATALALVNDAPTAQTIVAEWLEHSTKRPPSQVVGQVAKITGQMLAEGIDPDDVRRGLAAWMHKGVHPSVLPSVVNEVMNAPANRRGRAQQETDDLFDRAAARMGVTS